MTRVIKVDFSSFSIDGLADRLHNVKWNNKGGFSALCPAHDDSKNSLYVDEGDNGRVLVYCHAGCKKADIMRAIFGNADNPTKPPTEDDKFRRLAFVDKRELKPNFRQMTGGTPDAVYPYCTPSGDFFGFIARVRGKAGKSFVPFTPWEDKEGYLTWRKKGFAEPRPLYNRDWLAEDKDAPVLVVEGEKAADAAEELLDGPTVTTWHGGANAVHKTDWSPLRGRDVVIWPDNDEPGLKAAEDVAHNLMLVGAASVKTVKLPELLPKGWDLADDPPEEVDIDELITNAKPYEGALVNYLISAKAFCDLDIPPRELIVIPFVAANAVILLFAKRGVGKTWVGLTMGLAIATGEDFLCYEVPKPLRVLFIDGEMPAAIIKERLTLLGAKDVDTLDVLNSEMLYKDNRQLNIGKPEDRERIELMLQQLEGQDRKPQVIIMDNLSSLRWGRDENDNTALDDILQWLLKLRHLGFTVVLVHHAGKSGDQRGASRLEDPLDTSIKLEEVNDGVTKTGARMKLSFTKVRGDWPKPDTLVIQLVEGEDGILEWDYGENLEARPADATLNAAYYGPNGDASEPFKMQKELAAVQGIQPAAISKHLALLKRDELVEVSEEGIIVTDAGVAHLAKLYPDEDFE